MGLDRAGERPRRQSAPRTSFYHHFHIIGDSHIILSRFSVSLPQIRSAIEAQPTSRCAKPDFGNSLQNASFDTVFIEISQGGIER